MKTKCGQALIEYIIILTIIIVSSLSILFCFGDRARIILAGTILKISENPADKKALKLFLKRDSETTLKIMDEYGLRFKIEPDEENDTENQINDDDIN